ncbi:hypothetical protein ACOSQ3_031271 [Xanthoceras sorbifolium]
MSLAARVIKACYYPSSTFLQAKANSSDSFLWKSFLWGRYLLEKGSRWRVGNGSNINIYKDRWLPRPSTFQVLSSPPVFGPTVVSDLKTPSGSWNENLIRSTFISANVDSILSLPPCSPIVPDSLLWHFTKDGNFSVRSYYHVGCSIVSKPSSSNQISQQACWKFLWQLQLPKKIKLFI